MFRLAACVRNSLIHSELIPRLLRNRRRIRHEVLQLGIVILLVLVLLVADGGGLGRDLPLGLGPTTTEEAVDDSNSRGYTTYDT